MFEKLQKKSVKKSRKPISLEATGGFVAALAAEGIRLSYAGLTRVAHILGEDSSRMIPAQRGASLVKHLPEILQPYVCRKAGGYAKGVKESFKVVPDGLLRMEVPEEDQIEEAVRIYLEAEATSTES